MKSYKIVNVHGHLRKSADLDKLVKEWEKQGVVKFCVLALGKQWESHGYFTNADLLKAMKRYPDIIVGMGHLELGPLMDEPDKVERLKEQGFLGLKFISSSAPYSDERYFPYYEKAERLEMPIIFHVGIIAVEEKDRQFRVDSELMRPYLIDRIVRYFPKLKIIFAHPGDPHTQEALTVSHTFPNVYLCPSGGGGSDFHISNIKKSLSPFPKADWDNPDENIAKVYFKKFVFGTDNPPVSLWYEQSIKLMDYLHIEEETRELYFWKNACSIFGWNL
jgi:predicted TIM-barrel fold metal-dependent hydrolase